jgi:hypothetical protein
MAVWQCEAGTRRVVLRRGAARWRAEEGRRAGARDPGSTAPGAPVGALAWPRGRKEERRGREKKERERKKEKKKKEKGKEKKKEKKERKKKGEEK